MIDAPRASRVAATVAAFAGVAWSQSVAQAPVGPPAAVSAARAAVGDTAKGASLRVTLLTIGQGRAVWERFGHNMLWIRDERTGEEHAWNWGLFNFADPGFVRRFLFANTRYWMDSVGVQESLNGFHHSDREVVAQELALTAGQRAALDAFVRANANGESKFYRYDYFLDNCSTRLRDALDIVLDGAIRKSLEPLSDSAVLTHRSEALRLNKADPWMFIGMDFALGPPADRALNPWSASFIPMRLRDALRRVRVQASDGTSQPLVKNERVLIESKGPPEPTEMGGSVWPRLMMVGTLLLTLMIVGLGVLSRRGVAMARPLIAVTAMLVHGSVGFLATLVLFVWFFTKHWAWAWNVHLLLFTPASLAIAILVPLWYRRWKPGNWVEVYHTVMAAISFVVVIAVLVWYRQWLTPSAAMVITWANLSWMLHLALGIALARLPAGGAISPPTGRMDGTRAT